MMVGKIVLKVAFVTLVGGLGAPQRAAGQEVEHPREMNLQQSTFQMPDTSRSRVVLENGLMSFVIDDRAAPVVSFTMYARAGTGDDLKPGAAEMLALMLATRGPCWMAPGRFQETMDEMGAEFFVSMNAEMTEVNLNVAAEDARRALRIFSGIVRETCVDAQGLEIFRQAVANAERDRDIVESTRQHEGSMRTALERFYQRLYGDHPYGNIVTANDAAQLTVEDVEDFYRDYFSPLNVTIAVAGDFETGEMVLAVDQRFADWTARRPPPFHKSQEIEGPILRQTFRFPTDKLQTWIVIGQEIPPIDPADLAALRVMNYILGGGHFDTRLFREARDRRGLTNDASGFLDLNIRGPGTYTFRTSGRPEVADQLVEIVFAEIRRIQTEPVTEEELFVAKGALADGAFAMRFENGHIAARTFAEEWARYGSLAHLALYPGRIRDVSAGDVREAANRYLDPSQMIVVMLGPESGA